MILQLQSIQSVTIFLYEVVLMENVLNSIYSNSIMVQDQSNDTAKEAAVEAVHARVVAKPNFIRGSVELLVLYLLSQKDYYGYELSWTHCQTA